LISPAYAGPKLVILSPHWEGIKREFEAAFIPVYERAAGENVSLEWLDVGASSNVLSYIRSEFATHPQGIGVDIVWGGGTIYFASLASDGLLAPAGLSADDLQGIPAQVARSPLYDPHGLWFGAALTSFGILCNRPVLDLMHLPAPRLWADLAEPPYFSWVALADPRDSGTAHMMLELMLQSYGWEKGLDVVTRMGANAGRIPRAASQVPVLVATGDAACGPCIDFYAWAKMAEVGPDRLQFILPTGETVITADPIALLKGAPQPNLARAFIRFVLSPAGQKLWMLPAGAEGGPKNYTLGRLGVRPELYQELAGRMVTTFNPFAQGPGLKFNSNLAEARWQTLNDLFGALIVDPHRLLADAWAAAKDLPPDSPAWKRLSAVPEDEATFAARPAEWKDPERRGRAIAEWADFGQAKYLGVLRMAGREPAAARARLDRVLASLIPICMLLIVVYVPLRQGLRAWRRRKAGRGKQRVLD
jgi:ABC-type Fe3+ transport system substrate-binding protein